jgi:hypothetical protein
MPMAYLNGLFGRRCAMLSNRLTSFLDFAPAGLDRRESRPRGASLSGSRPPSKIIYLWRRLIKTFSASRQAGKLNAGAPPFARPSRLHGRGDLRPEAKGLAPATSLICRTAIFAI